MCQFANVVKEDDAKALLFVQVRKHVRDLARTEGLLSAVITWPVNKHLSPLSIDPQTLLKAHKLSDVTWHDIPERRWRFLTEEERTQLREDVWHYSRTCVSEDLARAASALADELEEDRLKLTNAFGGALHSTCRQPNCLATRRCKIGCPGTFDVTVRLGAVESTRPLDPWAESRRGLASFGIWFLLP